MMKHVKNMNNIPVVFIGENDFRAMVDASKAESPDEKNDEMVELRQQLIDMLHV